MAPGLSLFGADVPEGFHYREDFITPVEESALLDDIAGVEFANFQMRGVIARRRVAFFGLSYDDARAAAGPIPEFLLPLRARVAAWADRHPDDFAMALINEYRPGVRRITGAARQRFEHSIPPVERLRYSITFRTLRRAALDSRT
jgi:hypothetical protein